VSNIAWNCLRLGIAVFKTETTTIIAWLESLLKIQMKRSNLVGSRRHITGHGSLGSFT